MLHYSDELIYLLFKRLEEEGTCKKKKKKKSKNLIYIHD